MPRKAAAQFSFCIHILFTFLGFGQLLQLLSLTTHDCIHRRICTLYSNHFVLSVNFSQYMPQMLGHENSLSLTNTKSTRKNQIWRLLAAGNANKRGEATPSGGLLATSCLQTFSVLRFASHFYRRLLLARLRLMYSGTTIWHVGQ